jgi:hypothetical protein
VTAIRHINVTLTQAAKEPGAPGVTPQPSHAFLWREREEEGERARDSGKVRERARERA